MKGRLLKDKEVLQLDGQYVYIVPQQFLKSEEGKAKVVINTHENIVKFYPTAADYSPWTAEISDGINDKTWLLIYEWLEETKLPPQPPKIYKGSEIISLVEDGKLSEKDSIIDKYEHEHIIEEIDDDYNLVGFLKNYSPFKIKQKPVDFITAANSGKNIRPISLSQEKKFHPFTYWLGFMVSNIHYENKPLDLINGLWETEI